MIRFACPRCRTPYDVPDAKAGHKTTCPRCGQRLQVPSPPPSKTMLAPLVEYQPEPSPALMATWVLPVAGVAPEPTLLAILPAPESYRRPLWPFLVASAVALALLGIGLRLLLTGGHLRDAGAVAENRSHARTDQEELVKRFIVGKYSDENAAKVEFLTWGPHMSKQEWLDLLDEAGLREAAKRWGGKDLREIEAIDGLVRVRYRAPEGERGLFGMGGVLDEEDAGELPARKRDDGELPPGKQDKPKPKPRRVETKDEVFVIMGKLVHRMGEASGDDWKKKMRKQLAKKFPGISP